MSLAPTYQRYFSTTVAGCHVPWVTRALVPTSSDPLMTGALTGRTFLAAGGGVTTTGAAATATVGADGADALPTPATEAVTTTEIALPTSAALGVYVAPSAPTGV